MTPYTDIYTYTRFISTPFTLIAINYSIKNL
jgi:hypothetical protein